MATFTPKVGGAVEAVTLEREFVTGGDLAGCFSEQPEWLGDMLGGLRIIPKRAPDDSEFTGEAPPAWRGVLVATSEGPRPMMVGDYLMRGDLGQLYVAPADIFEARFKAE
jgi:hypothetical protein